MDDAINNPAQIKMADGKKWLTKKIEKNKKMLIKLPKSEILNITKIFKIKMSDEK